ncbi:hypothetical protein [Methylobacterium durans]|uniref:Uncharacterized protein n=1 Tax=Methylobacterium durans TaxID=2202825 RepID=A0A2U8WA67_9HYPH|nr:hypothetical protein [Methylobacterium durans]AWN43027.1 hypothetical protein DK389_24195 [Methylobacterium durans]
MRRGLVCPYVGPVMSRTAIDRLRRRTARTRATGSARSGRMGLLAGLLAVLILVLAGLPDERYATLMPRADAAAATALSAAPAGHAATRHAWKSERRGLAFVASADLDDPPSDDRRLVPDAAGVERLSPGASYPPRTAGALPAAATSLPERPPKSA